MQVARWVKAEGIVDAERRATGLGRVHGHTVT
jgi:hypothetical protein